MQLLHLTYSWRSIDEATNTRIRQAQQSWLTKSMAPFYEALHLNPSHLSFTSKDIGDRQPYPILPMIIQHAFDIRKTDQTIVMFTNADIRLRPNHEHVLTERIKWQTTTYEDCVHERPQKPTEAQSDPVTFFFSYRWWHEHKIFLPPVFFACPYWEAPFQSLIDRTTDQVLDLPQCTSHLPHPFFKPFGIWRSPARMYNHALTEGWTARRFNLPSMGRNVKMKRNP